MHDDRLQGLISGRVQGRRQFKKVAIATCASFIIGFGCAYGVFAHSSPDITEDELARLAALASCSTGEPASAVWLKAQKKAGLSPASSLEMAKQFLVEIDLNRCGIGQATNTSGNDRVVSAFPPSDRYN